MKIQFVTTGDFPHVGGKSSHIETVLRGMREQGHECRIVSYTDISEGRKNVATLKKLAYSPLRFINFDIYARKSERIMYQEFKAVLKAKLSEWKFDAILAEDPMAAVIASKVNKNKVPIVMVMHSYFGRSMGAIKKARFAVSADYFKRQKEEHLESLKVIAKLIGVDNRIKEECAQIARERGFEIPVVSIENFVDTEKYKPTFSEEEKEQLKKEYGVEGRKVITCIRRLCDKNGVIFAVDAMKNLLDDFVLLVGGDGDCRSEIEKSIADNHLEQKVRMLGSVNSEEVIRIYNISNYVVVPSITVNGLQEATSISALEAMSFKLPVIASSIGGLKQMIEDGKNGILVEERDSKAIADAINKLDNSPEMYKTIAEKSRADVIEYYSYLAGANRYISEIKSVLEK